MTEQTAALILGRFRPTAAERAALGKPRSRAVRARWTAGAMVALYLAVAISYAISPGGGSGTVPALGHVMSLFFAIYAITYGLSLALKFRTPLPDAFTRETEIEVRVDGTGVTFGANRVRIPWRGVAHVRDDGDALVVVVTGTMDEFPIPKRAFNDGGAELWSYANVLLTGTYHLIRSPHTRNLITNTRTVAGQTIKH